ncbi:MAG: hypothetical protein WCO09_05125, partial [bacterium]
MNKKYIVGVVVVVVVIIGFVFGPLGNLLKNPFRIPSASYQVAYRLVPEKVSKSAAITVSLPPAVNIQNFDPSKQVSIEPKIEGRWMKNSGGSIVPIAEAADTYETYYFQPNKALDLNKHYTVTLALAEGQNIRSDFLAVADPSVLSILPHDGEVVPNTKISIVFNRPM